MDSEIGPRRVFELARGMTLKNAAANLPFGGSKSGIIADPDSIDPEQRTVLMSAFGRLLGAYRHVHNPGPDVGTGDGDMGLFASLNGLNEVVSKPARMGGNEIDAIGAAALGVVDALEAFFQEKDRLATLPQCKDLARLTRDKCTVMIQGFGAVGASAARILHHKGFNIVGISDVDGYLYDPDGLDIDGLLAALSADKRVTAKYFVEEMYKAPLGGRRRRIKFSNSANDMLFLDADVFIPASKAQHYLQTPENGMTDMPTPMQAKFKVVIEGANTYSSAKQARYARHRMEYQLFHERGVFIAPDFLVNSGGVIFAAHERIVRTPENLLPPTGIPLSSFNAFVAEHKAEFESLASLRRETAEKHLHEIMWENVHQLVSRLLSDPDLCPQQAAEVIAMERMQGRYVRDVSSADVQRFDKDTPLKEAAVRMTAGEFELATVVDGAGVLLGICTVWDIAAAFGKDTGKTIVDIMRTKDVVTVRPGDLLLAAVAQMESNAVSCIPVVEDGTNRVVGIITSDMLLNRMETRPGHSTMLARPSSSELWPR